VPIYHFYGKIEKGTDRFSEKFQGRAMEAVNKDHPWERRANEVRVAERIPTGADTWDDALSKRNYLTC
jgi:hypothetical protein